MVEGMPFFNIATRYHVFFSHYFEFFGFYLWYTNANTHPFPSISIQVFNPPTSIFIHIIYLFRPFHQQSSIFTHCQWSMVIHSHQFSPIFIHFHPGHSLQSLMTFTVTITINRSISFITQILVRHLVHLLIHLHLIADGSPPLQS